MLTLPICTPPLRPGTPGTTKSPAGFEPGARGARSAASYLMPRAEASGNMLGRADRRRDLPARGSWAWG